MKTEELLALGLSQEQADAVFKMRGEEVTALEKSVSGLTAERDDLRGRLQTAETTLKSFDGIDPANIKKEVEDWKQKAQTAEKDYNAKIAQRDQRDWLKAKFDEYKVNSPYARRQLESECMSDESGLTWKDGAFFGFDDFMKSAKEKDASLYLTAEEQEAETEKANAPTFTKNTNTQGGKTEKYIPPKIF